MGNLRDRKFVWLRNTEKLRLYHLSTTLHYLVLHRPSSHLLTSPSHSLIYRTPVTSSPWTAASCILTRYNPPYQSDSEHTSFYLPFSLSFFSSSLFPSPFALFTISFASQGSTLGLRQEETDPLEQPLLSVFLRTRKKTKVRLLFQMRPVGVWLTPSSHHDAFCLWMPWSA
jgi:hypothetical protein